VSKLREDVFLPRRTISHIIAFFCPFEFKGPFDLICGLLFAELKLATGPYKAARDAYVAATATYTKSLYE